MKIVKKGLLIVLMSLTILAFLSFPCSAAASWKVFSSPNYGWSISYPDDWTIDSSVAEFVKIRPTGDTPLALVSIMAKQVRFKNIDEFVDFMLSYRENQFKSSGQTWKLITRNKVSLRNGISAVDVIDELGPGGKSRIILTLIDGLAVIVNAETYIKEWDNFSPTFDLMISSFAMQK